MTHDPQKFADNINTRVLPKLRILDWTLSFATLGWGIWKMSWGWILFGLLCVVMAWLDPGAYIKRGLERMFLGRHRRPPAPPVVMPAALGKMPEKLRGETAFAPGSPMPGENPASSSGPESGLADPSALSRWPQREKPVAIRSRDGIMTINYGMEIPRQVLE